MPQSSEPTYYSLLGLHPWASVIDIRRAYRQLSKLYHPDTTDLPTAIATPKFQQINEAYATLSHPERRLSYDLKIGYSRFGVIQPPADLNHPVSNSYNWSKSAYLDASDRPLSSGEIFALFILVLTFVGCLLLAVAIGLTRGEAAFQTHQLQSLVSIQQQITCISQLITHLK
ncbi:J domain-containing protein [Nostoc sp. NMS8]|uniref:J domain-containing protein n=1 Tax=Nostoc sp. NMS8 TaxID=2815392 RepID=UPI0025F113B1|nr:J domain-containing protein [Nostoc sp. NMS8]MBN3959685.1 J domain-containing protein [Nostoc sp. NMS8]